MSEAPVHPGDVLAGKYRVDRVLGVGGMGVVVQATHMQLEERVALKFMLPEAMQNAEIAGRFLREARLAVKLKSEHVAKVMDVGTLETGSPYIVMEYLEGTDLNHLVEKHGPLPFADVAEYVIHACDAIAEAHSLGIVHRDLKPANLFLTRRPDGAPLVKVLDFGISKANALTESGGAMTRTSTMMGSPYFMSPEQMRSAKDVDARSDVWSVGVIIYQLLTARLPFESDTLGGIMAQVLQDDPLELSRHRPDVPHAFQAVVARCLQRDRNLRARNVAEVAMMLAPYAPTRARPIAERIAGLLGAAVGGGTLLVGGPVAGSSPSTMGPQAAPNPGLLRSPSAPSPSAPPSAPVLGAAPALGAISVSGGVTGAPAGVPRKGSAAGLVIGGLVVMAAACAAGGAWWYHDSHRTTAAAAPPAGDTPTAPAPSATAAAAAPPVAQSAAPAVPPSAPPAVSAPVAEAPPTPEPRHAPEARRPSGGAARGGPPPGPVAPPPPAGPKRNVLDDRN
jgi:eukaryotic-like serine/threonine-protein kinase